MKIINQITMKLSSTLNRMCMLLALVTVFLGTQSFVQDDTSITAAVASTTTATHKPAKKVLGLAATDTIIYYTASRVTPARRDKTEMPKISINKAEVKSTDEEVYSNFLQENRSFDFSFLGKLSLLADQEVINNFTATAAHEETSAIVVSSLSIAKGEAASLELFAAANPAIQFQWNGADVKRADTESLLAFEEEVAPKVILAALSPEAMIKTDMEIVHQFNKQFAGHKERLTLKK